IINSFPTRRSYDLNRYQRAVEYKNKVVNRFTVLINQNSGSIDWGKVIVQNKRSSNLSKKEYLVQLFWVIKLIECGYRPENIIIESEVQLGRKRGYIDLVVNDQNGVPFLILDAKKDLDEFKIGRASCRERVEVSERGGVW